MRPSRTLKTHLPLRKTRQKRRRLPPRRLPLSLLPRRQTPTRLTTRLKPSRLPRRHPPRRPLTSLKPRPPPQSQPPRRHRLRRHRPRRPTTPQTKVKDTHMANYTVADIQALRERTGAGMLDVKKALDETDGDIDKAVDVLRVKGLKGVTKREGRSASEGLVATSIQDTDGGQAGTLIELNCETDFVAKNDKFIALADKVLEAVVAAGAADAEAANAAPVDGSTVAELITGEAGVLGEKIVLSRVARVEAPVVTDYLH